MFLLDWYEQYLDIKIRRAEKAKELQYCEACETLKLQLAVANDERKFLIEKLTSKDGVIPEAVHAENPRAVLPARISWNQRKDMLERESRETAKRLKENLDRFSIGKSSEPLTAASIEKELGVTNDG